MSQFFPGVLDQDLSSVGILLEEDTASYHSGNRGSVGYCSSGDEGLPPRDLQLLGE